MLRVNIDIEDLELMTDEEWTSFRDCIDNMMKTLKERKQKKQESLDPKEV